MKMPARWIAPSSLSKGVCMSASPRLLLVEDSPEDYETTVRALRKTGMQGDVFHCEDGDEALDFLHHRGRFKNVAESPRPSMVLLDLNLPGTSGRDVLTEIKSDDSLKTIPVVILTTSSDERDIEACYRAGANSYLHKPVDLEGFIRSIQRLKDYWFEIVVFPGTTP